VKVLLVGDPHAGQAGEVIDLIDAGKRGLDRGTVQHRAVSIFNVGIRRSRRTDIENADPLPAGAERFYEVMSDETAATGNQYESHEEGLLFRFWSYRVERELAGTGAKIAARSRRKPNAMNNFAMTNIGPSRKCVGWSTIDGCRSSKTLWPTICAAMPNPISTAKM